MAPAGQTAGTPRHAGIRAKKNGLETIQALGVGGVGGNLPAQGLQALRAPSAFASAQALAHVLRRPAPVPDACSIPSQGA